VRPTGEDRVRRLQAALTRHGFYHGPLDGIADSRTVQAILAYQISVGDPPSGTLTQTEIIRMLNNG
jgi:peptidoglycan hydrolase-like protein with peptidoglycan-binding domain